VSTVALSKLLSSNISNAADSLTKGNVLTQITSVNKIQNYEHSIRIEMQQKKLELNFDGCTAH